ncbi:hypothetical protein B0T16DRAFT_213329 [Cercophora newfieldiana]|uniref:Uncharacterized protein n=1 Tax=Cercophora newfieldiana TaxID=92897 RepID=A0AA40CJL7_9PEZI|nr:hypothetical protein B0T16DRAFT_213329 [Cercophora newfieldiana]
MTRWRVPTGLVRAQPLNRMRAVRPSLDVSCLAAWVGGLRRYWRDRIDCRWPCIEVWWGHRYFPCFLTPRPRPSNFCAVGRFLPRSWPLVARSLLGESSTYQRQNGAAGCSSWKHEHGQKAEGLVGHPLPPNSRAPGTDIHRELLRSGLKMLGAEARPGASLSRVHIQDFPVRSRPGDPSIKVIIIPDIGHRVGPWSPRLRWSAPL